MTRLSQSAASQWTNTHTHTHVCPCTRAFRRAAVLLGQWSGEQTNVPPGTAQQAEKWKAFGRTWRPRLLTSICRGRWVFSTRHYNRRCCLNNLVGTPTGPDQTRRASGLQRPTTPLKCCLSAFFMLRMGVESPRDGMDVAP